MEGDKEILFDFRYALLGIAIICVFLIIYQKKNKNTPTAKSTSISKELKDQDFNVENEINILIELQKNNLCK